MIEVRQIMIDNLIMQKEVKVDEYITQEAKVIKVDSIYFDALSPDVYLVNGYPTDFYDPILLTEEWLLKFNFNYSYKYDEWYQHVDHTGMSLIRNYDTGEWYIGPNKIMYLHEFQNMLRMFGTDVVIE